MNTGEVIALIKAFGGGGGGSSGGGMLVVNTTEGSGGVNVCDKTAAEMYQAFQNGLVQFYYDGTGYILCTSAANADGSGYFFSAGEVTYHADSGTDFPTDA